MITINNIEEMKQYFIEEINTYVFGDDVKFTFNLDIKANIKARDIKARDINARNINAWDIKAWDIKAWDIDAEDINAGDIKAWDIDAGDIDAGDIDAGDIDAGNIDYYAVCFAYKDIKCKTIKSIRYNSKHFCLEGEIIIKKEE